MHKLQARASGGEIFIWHLAQPPVGLEPPGGFDAGKFLHCAFTYDPCG